MGMKTGLKQVFVAYIPTYKYFFIIQVPVA